MSREKEKKVISAACDKVCVARESLRATKKDLVYVKLNFDE